MRSELRYCGSWVRCEIKDGDAGTVETTLTSHGNGWLIDVFARMWQVAETLAVSWPNLLAPETRLNAYSGTDVLRARRNDVR